MNGIPQSHESVAQMAAIAISDSLFKGRPGAASPTNFLCLFFAKLRLASGFYSLRLSMYFISLRVRVINTFRKPQKLNLG